ncbi:MAG: ankyrin repeat domain-containing protein [Crocosphaera sp.]
MIPFSRKSSLEQYYKILNKLGKGGMGTTYAAEDVNTGKKVALKVISLQNQTDANSLKLLEREVTVLKKLNHPNIPKYIDYFQLEDDNKLYLVQDLVPGKNLNQQVEEGLRLTEKEVKDIAVQVLSILDYLHNFEPRIIHRDIKPHNLILSDDGQIFLVDFGAVHNAYYNTMMGETVGIGTIGYMSPEQQIGKPVPASDLYSLGRTLLYLLTRRPPDHLLEHKATVNLEIIGDYIRLSDEFIEWLEKILDPDVDERFSSAKEALKALKNPKLVKQGKLSQIRWFTWLGLGVAGVVGVITFNSYKWPVLQSFGFPVPKGLCSDKWATIDYFTSGGKFPEDDANKCLLWAVKEGHKNIVEQAITYKANVNYNLVVTDRKKHYVETQTPLCLASRNGHKDIVELLIKHGAWTFFKGMADRVPDNSPLHCAAFGGHKDVIELLINYGISMNAKKPYANGVHVNAITPSRKTPLFNAVEQGHKDAVEVLIANRANVNIVNHDGDAPIHIAADQGNYDIVELLVSNGANVNLGRGKYRQTALHIAANQGDYDLVELLIANGANVNVTNRLGNAASKTPLYYAAFGGHIKIVEILIANGADLNAGSTTPLGSAAGEGHTEIVETLIANGADVNAGSRDGYTPLHFAAVGGQIKIVEILIANGANVNSAYYGFLALAFYEEHPNTETSLTALHIAAEKGNEEIVNLLIANGANVNSGSYKPLHIAAYKEHIEIVKPLINNGANVNLKDPSGKTPLYYAYYSYNYNYKSFYDKSQREAILDLLKEHGAKYPSQLFN